MKVTACKNFLTDDDYLTERGLTLAQAIVQLILARDEDTEVVAMALAWLCADVTCQVEAAGRTSHVMALDAIARQARTLVPLLAQGASLGSRRIM